MVQERSKGLPHRPLPIRPLKLMGKRIRRRDLEKPYPMISGIPAKSLCLLNHAWRPMTEVLVIHYMRVIDDRRYGCIQGLVLIIYDQIK